MVTAWVCLMLLGLPGPAGAQQKNEYIIEHTLTLPKGVVHAAVFSPDQKQMVTLGSNNSIRVWESRTARVTREIRTGAHQAVTILFHPKEAVVFTGGKDRTVQAWDISKGKSTLTLEGHESAVNVLLSDSEGKVLFAGSSSGKVSVWDVVTSDPRVAGAGQP